MAQDKVVERLTPSQVLGFARGLAAHGFDLHPQSELLLHDLLFLLIENGEWPDDPRQLGPILAPILCSSPQEQSDFHVLFEEFLGRSKPPGPKSPTIAEHVRKLSDGPSSSARHATALWLAAGILGLGLASWQLVRRQPVRIDQQSTPTTHTIGGDEPAPSLESNALVVQDPAGAPLAGTLVRYLGISAKTDSFGHLALVLPSPSQSFSILITRDGYQPRLVRHEVGEPEPLSIQMEVVPPQPVLPSPARHVSRTGWRGWVWNHRVLAQSIAGALPFLALGGWWFYLYRQRARLRRFLRPLELSTYRVTAQSAAKQLLRSATLHKSSLEFQVRWPRFTNEVAPSETIDASIRNGSRFTPIYASKRVPTEYLVLIERVTERDQQAQFYDELVQRLVAEGVSVNRYFFAGDPRECTHGGKDFSLADLASLHPEHHLWIVSDSDKFLNHLTGEPADWVGPVRRWKNRAILTSSTRNPFAEWLVRTQDFRLVTADPARLARLPRLMTRPHEASFVSPWDSFPGLMRDDPLRWLSVTEPPAAVKTELFTQVRRFLGATGYDCLSACAVYSALSWNLTVELTTAVAAGQPVEPILARLVRLPWFRWGSMPDWVRRRLAERLPSIAGQRTFAALDCFLEKSLTVADRTTDWLEYGRSTPADESLSFLGRWRDRILRREPTFAPAQDYVFLAFLWRNQVGLLAPAAPTLLRRLLFRRGYAMFGVHYFGQTAFALVIAVTGWLGVASWDSSLGPITVAAPPQPSDYPTGFLGTVLDIARASVGQYTGVPDGDFFDWSERKAEEVLRDQPSVRLGPRSTEARVGDLARVDKSMGWILSLQAGRAQFIAQRDGIVGYSAGPAPTASDLDARHIEPPKATTASPGDYLLPVVDWSVLMSPVRTNATIGSMTGVATAEVMESLIRRRLHKNIALSALYIYYRARLRDGTQSTDAGATLVSAAAEMQATGTVSEAVWPYDEKKIAQAPPENVELSLHYRIAWYRPLKTMADIRSALAGGPVVMGFSAESLHKVGSNGLVPLPLPNDQVGGGTAVAAVGYDDNNKRIKFLNSWGESWGDRGYGYLPYSYTQNLEGMALYGITVTPKALSPPIPSARVPNFGTLVQRGIAAYNRGDYNGAIQFYSQALAGDPKDGRALDLRAYSYFKMGRNDLAKQDLLRAVKLGYTYAHLDLARGECAGGDSRSPQYQLAQILRNNLLATARADGELQGLCKSILPAALTAQQAGSTTVRPAQR